MSAEPLTPAEGAGESRLPLARLARERVGRVRVLRQRIDLLDAGVEENRPLEQDLLQRVAALEARLNAR